AARVERVERKAQRPVESKAWPAREEESPRPRGKQSPMPRGTTGAAPAVRSWIRGGTSPPQLYRASRRPDRWEYPCGARAMADLKHPKLIYAKGFLFLLTGLLAGTMLIAQNPTLKTAALLAVCIWAFARFYY